MPQRLTLQHALPFAWMSDSDANRMAQLVAERKEFTIKVYTPDAATLRQLGSQIAVLVENNNEPDSQNQSAGHCASQP